MNARCNNACSPDLPDGLTLCEDGLVRPSWASYDHLLRDYYDTEWAMPIHDERGVFERLVLEGFQAGLSWRTILAKRSAFRSAFHNFEVEEVASMTAKDVDRLASDSNIIRNRRKIEAAVTNARATLAIRCLDPHRGDDTQHAHLGELAWSFRPASDPRPTCLQEVPTQLPESAALARELKCHGFRFVGPTTMLALMSAIGIVNTDIIGTHRRAR